MNNNNTNNNGCFAMLLVALLLAAATTDAVSLTLSSLPGAMMNARAVRSGSSNPAPNSYNGAHICTPAPEFSLNLVARDFPQFYSELGTWAGNISCYAASASGTIGEPQFVDAPVILNTTVHNGRLVSCSETAGAPVDCRAFYPRFDGSGQYCTVEPADLNTLGYPAFNQGQIINDGRVSVDTVWTNSQNLVSSVLSYYEPTGDAISTFYGLYNRLDTTGTTGPSMLCFLHFGRTCRGPACFTPPAVLP
ncbi:hypothetical protein pkur_cds_568 [Pandoravirus kuranda]|uniref:Uncharacterized protein n=2 Tax=Pandoravirus TaxID=2060084 RepID=A0AA95J3R3_9VIRU|nr:hypothetical protein pneo_cds_603 [Pandoravirus neocaledonia]AVK76210.1 hypothetical protein pneo_cds_603 [Pandoravirus neocaledonia]WBR14742.1 hypothetical protein pkur_cds_568 [Pandoravirus kuranda]